MADIDDSGSSSMESGDSGMESDVEVAETEETELYDPGYDHSEYEVELMDFSYEKSPEAETVETTNVNDKGEPVGEKPEARESYYMKEGENYNETGLRGNDGEHADWSSFAENADERGFDKSEPVTTQTLEPGTVISRYGSERGRFATDKGTDYSELSLPYEKDSMEYHEYVVCKPISCDKGKAAPNFEQKGGGTQYAFSATFADMVNDGTLKRV